jgi:hypothetical protein
LRTLSGGRWFGGWGLAVRVSNALLSGLENDIRTSGAVVMAFGRTGGFGGIHNGSKTDRTMAIGGRNGAGRALDSFMGIHETSSMIIAPGESPPGAERTILHFPAPDVTNR